MKSLEEIREKYDKVVSNEARKTMVIDIADYLELYSMAEYGELVEREQERERNEQDEMDRMYWSE